MNDMLYAELKAAHAIRESNYVIERAGRPIESVRTGLSAAAKRAGIGHVHPHLLRHSAAVHLAEDGVPMPAIARFLGHRNDRVTQEIYARFSPTYMLQVTQSLDYREVPSPGGEDQQDLRALPKSPPSH